MEVQSSTVVSIRYTMRNNKNEILQDNFGGEPIQYVHGSGVIVYSLEKGLEGASAGERKKITLNVNKQEYTFDVIVDDVRRATEEELAAGKPAKDCGCVGECKNEYR